MNRVIKIGSSSLYENGPIVPSFDAVAASVANFATEGGNTVVVSSAAIAFGRGEVRVSGGRQESVTHKQALASVRQIPLMIE